MAELGLSGTLLDSASPGCTSSTSNHSTYLIVSQLKSATPLMASNVLRCRSVCACLVFFHMGMYIKTLSY